MRILTDSPFDARGLISIVEADDNVPQTVIFCIPIDSHEAERLKSVYDLKDYFSKGISTKIKDGGETRSIHLDYISQMNNPVKIPVIPKFVANIRGHKIDFYLSPLNFLPDDRHNLNINFYYSGRYLNDDLFNKKLVIVEPNWRQLDKLFLEERIVFTDWR